MGKLALATSELDHLFRAYRDVRKRIQKSLWPHLAMELSHFEEAPVGALRDLQARLRTGAYRFSPKPGYAKKKSGGSRRGITVHGLEAITNQILFCFPNCSTRHLEPAPIPKTHDPGATRRTPQVA